MSTLPFTALSRYPAGRWLILPIRVAIRDLPSKLAFARKAAERGWYVVVGGKELVANRSVFPSGAVMIDKNDELAAYFHLGCDPNQALIGSILPEPGAMSVRSGSPKFDVYRHDTRSIFLSEVKRITRRYSDFILVNTKFSKYNGHLNTQVRLSKMERHGRLHEPGEQRRLLDEIDSHKRGFEAFVKLVKALAVQIEETRIVVRPHPQERVEPWQEELRGLPNVVVVRKGHVAPWIMASKLSIHSNCTTGIEAFLLDKPTISFRYARDERFDQPLPNRLSAEAFDIDSVLELTCSALAGEPIITESGYSERLLTAVEHFPNIYGVAAADKILDFLENRNLSTEPLGNVVAVNGYPQEIYKKSLRLIAMLKEAKKSIFIGQRKHCDGSCPSKRQIERMLNSSDSLERKLKVIESTVNGVSFYVVADSI